MSRSVLTFALALAGLLDIAPASAQTAPAGPAAPPGPVCAPASLFRAEIRDISPGVAAADRAAQPRVLWRLGSTFLRTEEQPDPVGGRQALTIVAEPDIWLVDLATGVGRHSVDPGPDFTVHAPILPLTPDLPPPLRALEFGCEPEFVMQHAPTPQQRLKWGATQASLHSVSFGEHSVALLMQQDGSSPIMISYLRQGRPVYVVRYDGWRRLPANQPELFQPPKDVVIEETPVRAPPPSPPAQAAGEPPPIPLGRAGPTPFTD